jgi:hypothetical protein
MWGTGFTPGELNATSRRGYIPIWEFGHVTLLLVQKKERGIGIKNVHTATSHKTGDFKGK